MAQECGLREIRGNGTDLAIYPVRLPSEDFLPRSRRTAMKFETLMLHSLFAACLLVCVLTFGAMLVSPTASNIAATPAPVATIAS